MNAHSIYHPFLCVGASTLLFSPFYAFAAGNAPPSTASESRTVASEQDGPTQIYGNQLMTPEERIAYRQKMREAKTIEEREKIRVEHHASMQARARERGITLPDIPPARGPGMGPGMGAGQGVGSGISPRGSQGAGRGAP